MLKTITFEKLDILVSQKEKLKIISFEEYVFRYYSQDIYSPKTIDYVVDIINEGFQFRPSVTHFIAKDKEGKIIGAISGYIERGMISSLYVHPLYQEQNIGSELITLFEKTIKEKSREVDCITIMSPPYSSVLLENNGYKSISSISFKGGIKVSVMRKFTLPKSLLEIYKEDIAKILTYQIFSFISLLG